MITATTRRRRREVGTDVLFVFALTAGGFGGGNVFERVGEATFTAQVPDALFTYTAGDSLAGATFARTGDATFTGDI
jgi:hypothetical protein